MKKYIIIIFIVLMCIILLPKNSLSKMGYNKNEIKIINKYVDKNEIKYIKKYDKSIIDLLTSKNYKEKYFKKYIKYYEKNSNSNIEDIITIINSNYNLYDYPASHLLANLTKEKYYLNKNISRYLDYGNNKNISSKRIISIVNSNADLKFYTNVKEADMKKNNLILVNKFYHLKDGYEPNDLIVLPSKYNKGTNSSMRKEAAEAFMKMADAALLDNIIIKNASAYRSYEYQINLYDKYAKRDGKEKADIYSARPGYSEHQTGLCSDINIIDSSFDNTDESKWLKNNAYKYGFILRFPKNKEDITGYKYESWHYRYVGKKAAKIIKKDDITLEEYYAYYIEK